MGTSPIRIDDNTIKKANDRKDESEEKQDKYALFTSSDAAWYSMLITKGLDAMKNEES